MTLEEYINKKQTNSEEKKVDFVTYLYKLMYEKGFDNPSIVYKRAHITKQLWSAITTKKCNPSLKSCLKIAIALKCDNHECKYLLKKAGYTLPSSSLYSLIIRYCIENRIYDFIEINHYLIRYGFSEDLID